MFKFICLKGIDVFYEGKFVKVFFDIVQDFGGLMMEKDLENYDIIIDELIWGDY